MQEKLSNEIAQLQKKLSQNQQSILFARLADLYLGEEKTEEAIDLCQEGLKNHPNYATGYYVLAKCFYSQKQYDEAEQRLKKAIAIEPKFVGAHFLYATILKEQGWSKSSEAAYRKIKEIDPFFESRQNSNSESFFDESIADNEPESSDIEDELNVSSGFEDFGQEFDQDLELDTIEPTPEIDEPESEIKQPEEPEKQKPKSDSLDDFREDLDFDLDMDSSEQKLEPPERAEPAKEESKPAPPDFPEEIQEETKENDVDESELISDLEEQQDIDYQENDLDSEEARFSELLDDIFRPGVDEEERNQRQVLESMDIAPEETSKETKAPKDEPMPEPESRDDFELDDEPLEEFDNTIEDIEEEPKETPAQSMEDSFEQDEKELSSFLASLEDDEEQDIDFDIEPELGTPDDEPAPDQSPPEERAASMPTPQRSEEDSAGQSTKEKFVTPTLGEIYAAQGQYEKAIDVFEMLAKKHPDNEWYQTKLEYLNKKLNEERNKE